jgi:hypothetical protein
MRARDRLLDRLRQLSRIASDSYLSASDWCPGHHQSSTLTPSTSCRYATTDCGALGGYVRGAREVEKPHCY